MANKKLVDSIRDRLNEVAELSEENEGIIRESATVKRLYKNAERIEKLIVEVDDLMGKRNESTPISSDDGTYTAYKQTIGASGVDMDAVRRTGLFEWFYKNHPECLLLDLKMASEILGQSLAAYVKRASYYQYNVSRDEDYRTMRKIISDYYDQIVEKEN